jgi:hypothetical protein
MLYTPEPINNAPACQYREDARDRKTEISFATHGIY